MIDPATEAALVQKLADFQKKGSDQIVVATIDTLDGEAIEPYANRLFRAWGLGQAGENNGVLLLVVKSDRKMRIEVGYGLEGTLTDLHTKLIIENTMVPAFRAGDFSGGISRAVDDMIMVLEGNAAELEARGAAQPEHQDGSVDPIDYFATFFIISGPSCSSAASPWRSCRRSSAARSGRAAIAGSAWISTSITARAVVELERRQLVVGKLERRRLVVRQQRRRRLLRRRRIVRRRRLLGELVSGWRAR